MKIETVVPLPPEDSGLQHCIARFHNRNMDSKRKDKTRFFRREPVNGQCKSGDGLHCSLESGESNEHIRTTCKSESA